MKTFFLISLILLVPGIFFSQQKSEKQDWLCPNPEFMGGSLCNAISGRTKDSTGKYQFYYQRIVHEAACVLDSDTEEEKILKIQKMWIQLEDRIVCENISTTVVNGTVLMFAVDTLNEDFIFDATYVWKVDLNYLHPTDGRTILDFVEDQIERHKGDPLESAMRTYYGMFREAGAKHRWEL